MWTLKYDTSELIYEIFMDTEDRLGGCKGGGRDRRGIDWEFGISRCKLLYREWMNNKVLLYSIGNYIQYPVINHNRKAYEKGCTYVCVCVYTYVYI